MKLKQLLGILLLTTVCTTLAAAAGTQLTQVSAKHVGDATLVSIQATGAFTHTEYRPSENLLLVDMTGVSASKLSGKTSLLNAPNVVGYRVLEYKASSGDSRAPHRKGRQNGQRKERGSGTRQRRDAGRDPGQRSGDSADHEARLA